MKKSRFLYLHQKCNKAKLEAFELLYAEYIKYLRLCVETLLKHHLIQDKENVEKTKFPINKQLASGIRRNAQDQANAMILGWFTLQYNRKLLKCIQSLFNEGTIDANMRHQLCIIGKCHVQKPRGKVTQEALDLYWSLLLNKEICGNTPTVSDQAGMRFSETTATLTYKEDTGFTKWWIGFTPLYAIDAFEKAKKKNPKLKKYQAARIQLPLVANPHVKCVADVSKGILARKDKKGRWRFEAVETKEYTIPKVSEDAPRLGIDVGLNVMVATSDGKLHGQDVKKKFNAKYNKIKEIRANRQKQGLLENSPRLDTLERNLSGFIKSVAGYITNLLVRENPNTVFVLEDMDLRGCKGQKRFAYRIIATMLTNKAATFIVNPAYTSQCCLVCGYVSRSNQKGTLFACRYCGKQGHADVVGAKNLLGRSNDKQIIDCKDRLSDIKDILHRRHVTWVRQGRHPIISVPLENCLLESVPPVLDLSAELESTRDLNEESC